MNKNYTEAYTLIEDMAQNHYQWSDERVISVSLPSKKEEGMNEISSLDHLSAKVDTLSLKFDKINVSVVTSISVEPPCGACGIFGHTSIDCQPGSAVESIEQINFVQYNQGMKQQNFYKKFQNPFGQTTPPSYASNQRVAQKSSLEILLESYFTTQSKQLQELKNKTGILNDSLTKLTSKVDFIFSHNKILETHTSQPSTNSFGKALPCYRRDHN